MHLSTKNGRTNRSKSRENGDVVKNKFEQEEELGQPKMVSGCRLGKKERGFKGVGQFSPS